MQEVFDGLELNDAQVEQVCRGLLDLAAVDGVDPREIEVVEQFYAGVGGDPARIRDLEGHPFDLAEARAAFASDDRVIDAFFMNCYLLIYADGDFTPEERQRIGEFAEALGVDTARLERLHVDTRVQILRAIGTGIIYRVALYEVGHELGLTGDQIKRALEG